MSMAEEERELRRERASRASMALRYAVSCAIANALYFALYWLLLPLVSRASLAVAVAYLCSVLWRHALHRRLVYHKTLAVDSAYLRELGGIYAAYSAAFVLNPLITEVVILLGRRYLVSAKLLHLSVWLNPVGFVGSLCITGVLNFFMVSAVFHASAAPPLPSR